MMRDILTFLLISGAAALVGLLISYGVHAYLDMSRGVLLPRNGPWQTTEIFALFIGPFILGAIGAGVPRYMQDPPGRLMRTAARQAVKLAGPVALICWGGILASGAWFGLARDEPFIIAVILSGPVIGIPLIFYIFFTQTLGILVAAFGRRH